MPVMRQHWRQREMADTPEVQIGDIGHAPVIPILLVIVGGYLAWFGVKYFRSDVAWPSDPIKAVLQGKPLPARTVSETSADILDSSVTGPGTTGGGGPVPSVHGGSAGQAQNIAKLMTASYGWSPSQNPGQWDDLVKLWDRESGWRWNAKNPSGAYGIPQALPGSKMASAGPDWMTNPATQIKWGLGYIKGRYGSPSAAWAHEESAGWY